MTKVLRGFRHTVPVEDIPENGLHLVFEDISGVLADAEECRIQDTAKGELFLHRVDGDVHVNGNVSAVIAIRCDRCLEEYNQEIDTSNLKPWELKARIVELYEPEQRDKNMQIRIVSFGFKYGLPPDPDLVFDVRFLPNPHYVDHLNALTGEDEQVKEYLWRWTETRSYFEKLRDLLEFSIPFYVSEGKTALVIAVGCTGGKHRSVVIADELGRILGSRYNIAVEHRDIYKS